MAPVPLSPVKVGHIDDVQELRNAKPTTIPERFVRDMTERPTLATALSSTSDIPVIDFSKLIEGDKDEVHIEILKLGIACEEWGFFQVQKLHILMLVLKMVILQCKLILSYFVKVINHDIELSLLESIEKLAKEFFMLPLEEKQKYPMIPGTLQGYGQAFVFSEDQKLDWCNMFALGVEPQYIRNPKLWPTKPAKFR